MKDPIVGRVAALLLLLLGTWGVSGAAHATGLHTLIHSGAGDFDDGTDGGDVLTKDGMVAPLSDSSSAEIGGASASAEVKVGYGWVQAKATAAAEGQSTAGGTAQGVWEDAIVIDAPGLTGTGGTVTFVVDVHGSLEALGPATGANGSANWALTLEHFSAPLLDLAAFQNDDMLSGDPVGSYETGPVQFVYGSPIELTLDFIVGASAGSDAGSSGATARADFSSTITWMGFGELRDAQGAFVTDFTSSSGSGVDFSGPLPPPVPEPHPAWLLGSAALVCLALRRRRSVRAAR